MYKILITSRSSDGGLHTQIVEFGDMHSARRAVEVLNESPVIMNGYVRQFAQALF